MYRTDNRWLFLFVIFSSNPQGSKASDGYKYPHGYLKLMVNMYWLGMCICTCWPWVWRWGSSNGVEGTNVYVKHYL